MLGEIIGKSLRKKCGGSIWKTSGGINNGAISKVNPQRFSRGILGIISANNRG